MCNSPAKKVYRQSTTTSQLLCLHGVLHSGLGSAFDRGVWELEITQLGIIVSCLDPSIDFGRDYPSRGAVTGTLELETAFVHPVKSTAKLLTIQQRGGPSDGDLVHGVGTIIERLHDGKGSSEWVADFGVPIVFNPDNKPPDLAVGSSIFVKSCLLFYPVSFGEINVTGQW